MNRTEAKKRTAVIAVTTIAAVAAIIFAIENQHQTEIAAQDYYISPGTEEQTAKTFWINTVHLDGKANIYGDGMHPPEKFPNSTLSAGGGFVLTKPDKTGAWMFRSFTFEPSMIVVHQGDKVTLNFIDVQGDHHVISVNGFGEFTIHRGEIHTITFIADKVGTIDYVCHVHMPNMHGQILVLPRTA